MWFIMKDGENNCGLDEEKKGTIINIKNPQA
jgi:hypothetical protein